MATHAPLCLYCGTREVRGEFSKDDGTGFCSYTCEWAANEVADEVYPHDLDGFEHPEFDA